MMRAAQLEALRVMLIVAALIFGTWCQSVQGSGSDELTGLVMLWMGL